MTQSRKQLIEEILKSVENMSEVINENLWYVNPGTIIGALVKMSDKTAKETVSSGTY